MKNVLLIGGGGHANVIIDIVRSINQQCETYNLLGFVDDNPARMIDGLSSLGKASDAVRVIHEEGNPYLFCAIGNNSARGKMVEAINQDSLHNWETFFHTSAVISPSAIIGKGTVVMPNAVVNANARIGNHCIINSGAVVEHDCQIGDYCHVSPNATLCGQVKVGNNAHIGAGATVIQCLTIGAGSIVGAGAVVIRDVPENVTVKGVPAL